MTKSPVTKKSRDGCPTGRVSRAEMAGKKRGVGASGGGR